MNDDLIADACWIVPTDPKEPAHKLVGLRDLEYGVGWPSMPIAGEQSVELFGPVTYSNCDMPPWPEKTTWQEIIKTTLEAYIKNEEKRASAFIGVVVHLRAGPEVSWKFRLQDNGDDTLSLLLPDDDPTPHIGRFHADDREQGMQR